MLGVPEIDAEATHYKNYLIKGRSESLIPHSNAITGKVISSL